MPARCVVAPSEQIVKERAIGPEDVPCITHLQRTPIAGPLAPVQLSLGALNQRATRVASTVHAQEIFE